jgi:hypothetical protein
MTGCRILGEAGGTAMFGWFKKKRRFDDVQRQIAKLVVQTFELTMGMHMAAFSSKTEAATALLHNKPVLGYMFGFSDGMLQDFRTDPPDEGFEVAVLHVCYDRMFGDDGGGTVIYGRSVALQGDPEFVEGQQRGGNEAIRYRRDGTPPTGLFQLMGTAPHA